jgi:putative DNA primase/helicase
MSAPTLESLLVIPQELRDIPNWVSWRLEHDKYGEETKVPYRPGSNRRASVSDPKTWTTFDAALAQMDERDAGLGWVVSLETGLLLIDLDHCINVTTGDIALWAQRILERVPSYAEASPRDGIHSFVKGALPDNKGHKFGHLEMYSTTRFFTMTGAHITGTPLTIEPVDVGWLYRLLTAKVFVFTNDRYKKLMVDGDWQGQGFASQSEGDLALCSMLAKPGLPEADIDSAFRLSGLYREKWERLDYRTATIATALASPTSKPAVTAPASTPAPAAASGVESSSYSDDWLALKFAATYGADLRFTASTWRWNIWNGKFWEQDETGVVSDLVRETCRQAAIELDTVKAGKGRQIASGRVINSVEKLARSDSGLAAIADQWDHDLWLLNTPSGTVDLRTGEIREHRRQDYITKTTSTALAPAGTPTPLWSAFLKRVTDNNSEFESYLQRGSGYCLTGVTTEQVLFFLFGLGANGKSVYVNTVCNALGDYARTAPIETFLASSVNQHPTELASLHGARLVVATETSKGRWDESRIKMLTAGERIAARFVCRDFFQYVPQFKLMISGNNRPALRSVDAGIRRRMHLLPFIVTIPEAERDRQLTEKLRAELPGILRWMIHGCLEWQKTGLNPPAVACEATNAYLDEEDVIGRWIEDRCELGAGKFTATASLFLDWKEWTESRGEFCGSIKSFSQGLEAVKGVCRHRTPATRGFRGIELRGGYHPPDLKHREHM